MPDDEYWVDLAAIKEDIALALGTTARITRHAPCWKCGAKQPAHACLPADTAKQRLLHFAGAESHGNKPLRVWPGGPVEFPDEVIKAVGNFMRVNGAQPSDYEIVQALKPLRPHA